MTETATRSTGYTQSLQLLDHAVSAMGGVKRDTITKLTVAVYGKAAYARSRAALLAGLPRAGFTSIAAADGAFYLWCDVGHLTNDSAAFCAEMLDKAGIAATTGLDFDRGRGARFLRFSYCGAEAEMKDVPARLKGWLGR